MNYKTTPSNFFSILFLILMIFTIQSCGVSARNRSIKKWEKFEWKISKVDKGDVPSWKIYSRKIKGTTSLEYKIEGTIDATPTACLSAVKKGLHQQSKESKKYPTYTIKEESSKVVYTYVIHKEPFPLKNTEMSVRYSFFNLENGATGVDWKEAWEQIPRDINKNLKRIETFRGSWRFVPIHDNSNQAIKSVRFDPKKMPKWLFEPMVFKFLKDELKTIEEITNID